METRQTLEESVQKIATFQPDDAHTDEVTTTFNNFKKAVIHASKSTKDGEGPQELLGDLEPKGAVLTFLLSYYESRRIFRKQIASVIEILLQVDTWYAVMKQDVAITAKLPDDIEKLLHPGSCQSLSHETKPVSQAATRVSTLSATLPAAVMKRSPFSSSGDSSSKALASSSAAGGSIRRQRLRLALPESCFLPRPSDSKPSEAVFMPRRTAEEVLATVQDARLQMRTLRYSAANMEAAADAFDAFRKGAERLATASVELRGGDCHPLDRIGGKGKIIDFLIDMYERYNKYRARLTQLLTKLFNFQSWIRAAVTDVDEPEPLEGSPASATSSTGSASAGRKWTPWGVSPSDGAASPATMKVPSKRNPFARDVAEKQRWAGGLDLWSPSSPASLLRRPSKETAFGGISSLPERRLEQDLGDSTGSASPALVNPGLSPSAPASLGNFRPPKRTNPFGMAVRRDVSPQTPQQRSLPLVAGSPSNPFRKDVLQKNPGVGDSLSSHSLLTFGPGTPTGKIASANNPFRKANETSWDTIQDKMDVGLSTKPVSANNPFRKDWQPPSDNPQDSAFVRNPGW